MNYTCINIQGNLISEDVLRKIDLGEASGQSPRDFGMDSASTLRSEMEYAWSRIKLDWKYFYAKSSLLPASDPYGTTLTRKWMTTFFSALGFELVPRKSALTGGNNQSYAISHVAGNIDDLPVHIVGFHDPAHPGKNTIDSRSGGGSSRLSPHATVQEFLNVTEHLYGIAANGLLLRLMRDSGRLVKLIYLEFDLRRMLEEDKYSEFTLLFRLLHASRFPRNQQETESCLLETFYNESIESGNRIRDGLSLAVQKSLLALGNGFLQGETNERLRRKLRAGQLSPADYYRQLRRLVYRLLFLMVAEERDLVYDPAEREEGILHKKKIYFDYYSISRLRKLSRNRYLFEARYNDLWLGLLRTFTLFSEEGRGRQLAIEPLGGDLFDPRAIEDLDESLIGNDLLLECIRNLNEFTEVNGNLVPINYRSLDVEEFGSVYEGLLDLHPIITGLDAPGTSSVGFTFHSGTDRKTTASYYTRPDLVNEIMKSAVIPVVEERLRRFPSASDKANTILGMKVCDPAAGSGHFLLATARTLAWYHARVTSGEENPAPGVFRHSLRLVIQHCIYGVDLNPDAVELCKLALWIESHDSGKPLSFLDHKIRCGNSLVGMTDLTLLKKGIPDEAFDPVTGDDKVVSRTLKRDNSRFRSYLSGRGDTGFQQQLDFGAPAVTHQYGKSMREVGQISQDSLDAVHKVKHRFEKMRSDREWFCDWQAGNLWTAAFFYTYTPETLAAAPTSEHLHKYLNHPAAVPGPVIGHADGLSMKHHFFHWPLEFPDVFDPASGNSGFDVMVGNPPWERIKLQQQEFFAVRDPVIANAPNAAARNRMIEELQFTNPLLYHEYQEALHTADSSGKFLRHGGRNDLTAVGDINTYSVFAELFSSMISPRGKTGFIVPTGIATDDSNKAFFGAMVERNRLVSLFDFENREKIFKDVDSRYKFCLLTLQGSDRGREKSSFGFFLTRVEHLQDKLRVFNLSREDFLRLNPNTRTCPVFRTSVDAALTTDIYRRVPVLINETTGDNPWGVTFKAMFHMSNDSHLFRTRPQLEAEGFHLWGNKMVKKEQLANGEWQVETGDWQKADSEWKKGNGEKDKSSREWQKANSEWRIAETWLPLYEAKMIWHYDHRYCTFENADSRNDFQPVDLNSHQNPSYSQVPWYWLSENEVIKRLEEKKLSWLIGFRKTSNATNERTSIFSVFPAYAANDKQQLLLSEGNNIECSIVAALNSIPLDYFTRQKVGGTDLSFHYVRQFPIIEQSKFDKNYDNLIKSKFLELTFTSWDLKAFADDVWKEADDDLKEAIRNQWEENQAATGGHPWSPPEWSEEYGHTPDDTEGCPLPPFKWDEERRAILKAELDAIYARLYGLNRKQLRYILDPADLTPRELENILDPWEEVTDPLDPEGYAQRSAQSTFPGETFRVLKEKDIRQHGEYRTRRLVLEAWERQNKS